MKNARGFLTVGLTTSIVVSLLYAFGIFAGLELFLEDRLLENKPISSNIVIVTIDDASMGDIGQWPWPRSIFADALKRLDTLHPKIVGIDILFSEPSRFGLADDNALAEVIDAVQYPLVLPIQGTALVKNSASFTTSQVVQPLAMFQKKALLGHVNLIADPDGIIRLVPMTITDETARRDYTALGTAISGKESSGRVTRIVYAGAPGAFPRVSFRDLLEGNEVIDLKDKIVLIGATAGSLHDTQTVPLGNGAEMSGVEIQANIANMVLNNYHLLPLANQWVFLWILMIVLIITFLYIAIKSATKIISASIIIGITSLIFSIVLFERGTVSPIIHTQLAWILVTVLLFVHRYIVRERDAHNIKQLFGKYVSGDVLSVLLKNPHQVKLGGEEKEITVFFSDIRSFTTMSEKLPAKEVVRILNKYFTVMSAEVLKTQGVVDKYIGDAIMAFWGAPLDDHNHADHAMQASLEMLKKLKILNEELRAAGDPEINIGIGLHTGPAVVGNIGSDARFDYTIIGDTVNAASRLESLNKEYKTQLIISQGTKDKLKGSYKFKPLGDVAVKGKSQPITIYTIDQ